MSRNVRIGILVAFVIVAAAVVAVLLMGGGGDEPATPQVLQNTSVPGATAQPDEPTATPVPTQELVEIVVAVQNINRGSRIPPGEGVAVRFQFWPLEALPFNAYFVEEGQTKQEVLESIYGRIARTDIQVEQPILRNMLVDDLEDLAEVGSDAAAILPQGRVAITVPIDRWSSTGYAIQPGDRVDIIVSFFYQDIDEEFQTYLPNTVNLINSSVDDETNSIGLTIGPDVNGRFESRLIPLVRTDPNGNYVQNPVSWPVIERPGGTVIPRLITQNTIRDVLVIHTGEFPRDGVLFRQVATNTPIPPTAESARAAAQPTTGPAPTATELPRPDMMTIAVSPQEAVMLTWLMDSGVPLNFVLRAAGDRSRVPTDMVTLQYVMDAFGITEPVPIDFTIIPNVRIRQSTTLVDFNPLNNLIGN
ncbi:MAG: hypothetical protein Kow00117_07090 [Phototrophicales bacterium]